MLDREIAHIKRLTDREEADDQQPVGLAGARKEGLHPTPRPRICRPGWRRSIAAMGVAAGRAHRFGLPGCLLDDVVRVCAGRSWPAFRLRRRAGLLRVASLGARDRADDERRSSPRDLLSRTATMGWSSSNRSAVAPLTEFQSARRPSKVE